MREAGAFLKKTGLFAASEKGSAGSGPLAPGDLTIGQRIGRYRLLEKTGEGGCGVVYVAEQEEPVRRRVALKVIKLGMDTNLHFSPIERGNG